MNIQFIFKLIFIVPFIISCAAKEIASSSVSVRQAEAVVDSIKPENVVVKFNPQAPIVDGSVLTLIRGVGHAPSSLELTTFRKSNANIQIFSIKYSPFRSGKDVLQSRNSDVDKKYLETDFYYELKEGEIEEVRFKKLIVELTKVHSMKTYGEYKTFFSTPVGFEDKTKGRSEVVIGGTSFSSSSSSSNYVSLVNLWSEKDKGFLYSFSGYNSSSSQEKALKVNAMAIIIENFLASVNLTLKKEVLPSHREYFQHQLATAQEHYNSDSWWWVKSRILALAGELGTEKAIRYLLYELESDKAKGDKQSKGTQRIAATSLARITKKDFRFDNKGQPLPIETTANKYTKEFSKYLRE